MKTVDEYISDLKKGNNIRIIYNKRNDDYQGGWWQEELWEYKAFPSEIYFCSYPVSSYKDDYYSALTETEAKSFLKEAIRDVVGNHGEDSIQDIIIEKNGEECYSVNKLEEKYLEQMKMLKDESDHDEADYLLCELLEELGFTEIVEVYRKLPKWYL